MTDIDAFRELEKKLGKYKEYAELIVDFNYNPPLDSVWLVDLAKLEAWRDRSQQALYTRLAEEAEIIYRCNEPPIEAIPLSKLAELFGVAE